MNLWLKARRTIFAITALAAWLGVFALCDNVLSSAPLDEPLSLNPPESIEKYIWLRVPETYLLEFTFSRANSSFEELQELIGGWNPDTDGVPIQIAWSLSDKDGTPVAGETTIAKGAGGWADDVAYRSVAKVQVAPGKYHFRARVHEPVPQLAHLSPRLHLVLNLKFTSSWQMAVLWWGMIINTLLGLPILVGLVAYLLFIVIRHLTSGSSGPASLRSASR